MTSISYSELKKGVQVIINNQPYEIIKTSSMFKGRGHSVLRAKLKNLITGNIISRTFHPSETVEEAELTKLQAKFLYSHRDKFVFCEEKNPSKRFELTKEQIGSAAKFLKPNQIVQGIIFEDKVINISLPIKISLRVDQAPPGVKGDRAQGGTKSVILETGAEMTVPLFIEEGDIIEINTEKNEYVRRIEKSF